MKRRVVITGLGAITSAGVGVEPLWEAAVAKRPAIGSIQSFPVGEFPVRIAGEIRDFNPQAYIPRKTLKVMARDIQLAVAASRLAVEHARLNLGSLNPERIGTSLGAGLLSYELEELAPPIAAALDSDASFHLDRFGSEGLGLLFPLWLLKYLPNMPACHVSILLNLQGPSNSITTACASSTQAIGEACRVIERGAADLILAGGAESKVNPIGLSRYQLIHALSQRRGEPTTAYRPFDVNRDGLVVGEGAGMMVLEELEHARRRGATIYAEITGYGSAPSLGRSPYEPDQGQGSVWAMERALRDAGCAVKDLSYIHAHGLGSVVGDAVEAKAIRRILGSHEVPVVATKPLIGYTGFAAGALDLILASLSVSHQQLLGTANCDQPDPALPIQVHGPTEPASLRTVLLNSYGFGGTTAALVIERLGSDLQHGETS